MIELSRRRLLFSVYLSAIAGFVDSIGFLSIGGYFLSFMSGNTTRLGVEAGMLNYHSAFTIAGIVGLFIVGVIVGSLAGKKAVGHGRDAVLLIVTSFLLLSAGAFFLSRNLYSLALAVLAMGAINTVYDADLNGEYGFTFVTGALVRSGKRMASHILGESKWEWVPYLLLWGGLASGAVLGAVMMHVSVVYRLILAASFTALGILVSRAENKRSSVAS